MRHLTPASGVDLLCPSSTGGPIGTHGWLVNSNNGGWSQLGGNGTGSGASPVMGFYLSSVCPAANTGQCYYTPADTQIVNTCGWTTANSTVTCTGSPFVAADVGKAAYGWANCQAYVGNIGTNAITTPTTGAAHLTISGYTDANNVTLSSNPANTQSGTTGCFIWGHPDDTGAAAMDSAAQAAPYCAKVFLASANFMFIVPHFYTNPTACAAQGTSYPNVPGLGNVFYSAGYEIEGRGVGPTVVYLTPGFPETGSCNHGRTSHGCFVVPGEGRWSDIQINGGSNDKGTNATTSYLIEEDGPATLDRVTCLNWGYNASGNVFGIYSMAWSRLYQVNNSGCGSNGWGVDGNNAYAATVSVFGTNVAIENNKTTNLVIEGPTGVPNYSQGYNLTCVSCQFEGNQSSTAMNMVVNLGGGFRCKYCSFLAQASTSGLTGYQCTNYTGCLAEFEDTMFNLASGSGNQTSIYCVSTYTCTNYLRNTTLQSLGTGYTYRDTAGSYLYDQGGNTLGSGTHVSVSGQVYGEANSANATIVTAAKLVLSAGWGSTAAWTSLSGGDFPVVGTITNSGTGQGATPTITYTFPTPLIVAPISCTATDLGGTNPLLNPFTTSSLTATGATFTATGTPTVSDTEIMQITCVTY